MSVPVSVGPVLVSVESPSERVREWARAFVRSPGGPPLRTLHVVVRESDEVFAGPPHPSSERVGSSRALSYRGWRAVLEGDHHAEACLSVAGDTAHRGPRRLQSLLRIVAESCFLPDGLALHGAGVVVKGRAYALVGARTAGKTTLAREFEPADRLGDDHIVAMRSGDHWRLFGTPFAGREGLSSTGRDAPLRAIALLAKGPVSLASRLAVPDALRALIPCVIHAGTDAQSATSALECLERLVREVPVLVLERPLGGPSIDVIERSLT